MKLGSTSSRRRLAGAFVAGGMVAAAIGLGSLGASPADESAFPPACNSVFFDWIYDSPDYMMYEFDYCIHTGSMPWDAPYGSPIWIDDHSA